MTNVMGHRDLPTIRSIGPQAQASNDDSTSLELLRPILMLIRRQLCFCTSISISNNPLRPAEVDDLGMADLLAPKSA